MAIAEFLKMDLSPERALQDKIKIEIGKWNIRTVDQVFMEFLIFITEDARELHENKIRAFSAYTGGRTIGTSLKIDILSNINNPPLFSGYLKIRRSPDNLFILSLELSINPTRFCAYQSPPLKSRRLQINGEIILFFPRNNIAYEDEHSLDRRDNVLLSPSAKLNASPQLYQQNFQRYIQGIRDYLNNELRDWQSICGEQFSFSQTDYYSLKYVEHYWEFFSEASIATVKSLQQGFQSLTNDYLIHDYQNSYMQTEGSSMSLRANFRTGERLKIYAKTNKRVRIEVSHNNQASSYLSGGSYTRDSLIGIFNVVDFSKERSSELATKFIRSLRKHIVYPEVLQSRALDFVTMLYRSVNDIAVAEEILTTVTSINGIPRKGLSPERLAVLEKLIKDGIFIYLKSPINRYTVDPRFMKAVSHLLERGIGN